MKNDKYSEKDEIDLIEIMNRSHDLNDLYATAEPEEPKKPTSVHQNKMLLGTLKGTKAIFGLYSIAALVISVTTKNIDGSNLMLFGSGVLSGLLSYLSAKGIDRVESAEDGPVRTRKNDK